MAQWQVSLVDGLMDFSFSILIALFYASVLSARYGKTKFRVIVSAVMIIATIITNIIHMPQMPMFFTGIAILMTCIFILSDDKPLKKILFTFIPYVSDILLSLVYLSLRTILMPNFDSAFGGQTLAGLSSIPNAVEPLLLFTVEMLILFSISKWIQHKKPNTFNNNCSNIYTDVLTLHLLCKNKYIEICIGLNCLYDYFNFAYISCYTLQYSYQ